MIESSCHLAYYQKMKLLLRQSCVFMLLLLQVFAPLVHAHTETKGDDNNVHIHHFHSYVSSENSDSVEPLPTVQHLDVVIDLNSAIQEKNDLKDLFPRLYVQLYLWNDWQPRQPEQSIDSPPFFKTSKTSFKLLVIAPRAPPTYKI